MIFEEGSILGRVPLGYLLVTIMERFVTVIVLSKNWTTDCDECLASLRNQDYPSSLFEIIFVLDPHPDREKLKQKTLGAHPEVRIALSATAAGISSARNDGILLSKGELVAFTDSDCRPTSDWLSKMVECAEKTEASIIGGRVITDFTKYLPPILTANINLGSAPLRASGCNVLYRKSAVAEAGGFDRQFRRGCDDYDLMLRLLERGHKFVFCKDAVVFHELDYLGLKGIWRLSADSYTVPLLFKRHPAWTREWLRMTGRFTRSTVGLAAVLASILSSSTLVFLFGPCSATLTMLAFMAYAIYYARFVIPREGVRTPSGILIGSLAMLMFSLFTLIWRARGSLRYRTMVL